MELATESHDNNNNNNNSTYPVILHTAEDDHALVLTVCRSRSAYHDGLCTSSEDHSLIEQITLLKQQDKILYFDLQLIRGKEMENEMHNKKNKNNADTMIHVAATVSNDQKGCELVTFLLSLEPLKLLHQETIRTVAEPFHIDETTALPVTGLDNPIVARDALLYWDISHRQLILLFQQQPSALSKPASSFVVAGNTTTSAGYHRFYNPGAWARMVSVNGSDLVVTFFDLEQHSLFVTQCHLRQGQYDCKLPQLVDATAYHGDFTDYGAGAFPDLQLSPYCRDNRSKNSSVGCPVLVYFVQKENNSTSNSTGCLRVMICVDPHCQHTSVFDVTCGLAGYGRDASLTFPLPNRALVSFLDLRGHDDPAFMQTKLALFEVEKEANAANKE